MADQKKFQEIHSLLVEFPELHHQGTWEAGPELNNTCGTTRCVAGWAVWLKAVELGLISRKRDRASGSVLDAVAAHYGTARNFDTDDLYIRLGADILGISLTDANSLFYDMNPVRVTDRVKSYAETGEDITYEELCEYDAF